MKFSWDKKKNVILKLNDGNQIAEGMKKKEKLFRFINLVNLQLIPITIKELFPKSGFNMEIQCY